MKIQGIDHVEFCVGDLDRSAALLCDAFGFQVHGRGGPETGQDGERSVLLRQGHSQLLFRSGLTGQSPAAQYVRKHGDGVAAVAFSTDDVGAAFTTAVAGGAAPVAAPSFASRDGARVGTATVCGFGDVLHRFIERSGPGDEFAPGMVDMAERRPAAAPEVLLDAIDHLAVCLPAGELAATVRLYQDAFGLSQIFDERIEVGGQAMISKVVQDSAGEVTFTLIEPDLTRDPGQIDGFLESHDGPGVQHVAFRTVDIIGAVATLSGRGIGFLTAPDGYYRALEDRLGAVAIPVGRLQEHNVLADRDRWGQMFQIFTKSVHERRTFFWELIERRGALTFGSKNITALYEALEDQRQRLSTATAEPALRIAGESK
ncbi:MAG TPA: 4-hydroxyphenylpyruvate dioxygenase [Streptosporangiaceae bacterium]|jgi:4-hydroxymandelate synthase